MAELVGKDPTVAESAANVVPMVATTIDHDLEVLQPEDTFVEINNEKIFVKEFNFRNMLKALKHINNMVESFDEELGIERNVLRAFAEHEDDVLGLLAISTQLPLDYFDNIPADAGIDLAIKTYEVNKSFFVQNILPKIENLLRPDSTEEEPIQEPVSKSKKAGSTSSKS